MSCNCQNTADVAAVPDFTAAGFTAAGAHPAALDGVLALQLSVCVAASTEPGNKVCFSVPGFGKYCVTSPVPIPPGAQLKACAQTCGSIIPTGLKVTIYLNGTAIYTGVLWGSC